ncbi:hypothetical protein JAO29_10400 [Edaphobacter sp. HDX4]
MKDDTGTAAKLKAKKVDVGLIGAGSVSLRIHNTMADVDALLKALP